MLDPKAPPSGKARAPLVPAVARINVTEPYSVRQWSTKFGCSIEQLRAAVTAVGNVAADVEQHLKPVRAAGADREALREAFGDPKSNLAEEIPSSSPSRHAGAADGAEESHR